MIESIVVVLLAALIITPLILFNIRIAPRWGLIDWPKARGLAEDQIPIVGHSMVLASVILLLIGAPLFDLNPWFVATSIVMAVMGYFDDRKPLPALDKMFFQIVCVAAIVLFDPNIHESMTVKYGPWGTFWAIFFILGLVNAINFIDGIDGLAGLVLTVGSIGFLLFSSEYTQFHAYQIYAAVIVGMMAPFLYFNVVKRRGFLGNVGSYFFSYLLACMHLSLPVDSPNPVARLSLSGLCFLIPIADAVVVCTTRILSARSPFQADKGHLHHRLIQSSVALRYILFNFGVIELVSLAMAYCIFENELARSSLLPIFICLSHVVITAILIVLIERASRRRLQGYLERMDAGDPIYFIKYRFRDNSGQALAAHRLRRLEARINAEIRTSDMCFIEGPDQLYVTLRTLPEPLRRIAARIENVFRAEKLTVVEVLEEGEFVKVPPRESVQSSGRRSAWKTRSV